MIDLKLNTDGTLTEEGQKELKIVMSELAQKCLVVLASLTAEDLRAFTENGTETENVHKVKTLLEDVVVESDIPVILTSSIAGELKLVQTLLNNVGNAFANAQSMISIDAMGKTKETEVSVKDVVETYNKIKERKAEASK